MPHLHPVREFTLRGVLLGALITLAFTAANVYLGLKVGLTFASAIPAAVISMALLYRFQDSNILENNLVQTQASAAGTLSSVIFVLPGLLMLGVWTGFPFWQTALICAAGGTLGVLFTVPLRRVMVVQSPHLPYPEGVAAAEVLRVGEAQRQAVEGARQSDGLRQLGWGAGVAALFGLCSSGLRVLGDSISLWLPAGSVALRVAAGFSPALLAAGFLMGTAAGAAVLLGLVLCWWVIVPWLATLHPPEAQQTLVAVSNQLWADKARFVGAGVIGISALWTVATLMRPILAAIRSQTAAPNPAATNASVHATDRDMPRRWMLLLGVAALGVLLGVVDHFIREHMPALSTSAALGLSLLCVAFAAVFGFLVAAACGYMAGLVGSSASPISGIGIIATILMGLSLLALHHLVPVFESSVAGQLGVALVLFMVSSILAMAAISNDNLQDLKTGYLVGATPWRQQLVLVIGCLVGAAVIPPVLELLYNAYGFAGALPRADMDPAQALAAPQATLMTQIANGIFTGSLDWSMLGLGVAIGVAVIVADVALRNRARGALPPLAVGLGIYLPPTIGMTLVLGALLGWLIQRALQRHGARQGAAWVAAAQERGLLLASGLIVGESLMGLLIAALIGLSGSDAPMALVGPEFAPARWLGLVAFAALCVYFYRRVVQR